MPAGGRIAIVVAGLAAALTLPASASAVERFASPTGVSGNAPCATEVTACDIQTAIEGAANGDVVTVLMGNYTAGNTAADRIDINFDIDVRGEPGQPRPVLTSAAPTGGIFMQNGASLSRFELIHTDPGTTSGIAVFDGEVHGVVVEATSAAASAACQILQGSFTDSVCRQSGGGRAMVVSRAGVGSTTATLRNNTLVASGPAGLGLFVFAAASGQETANVSNVIADGGAFDIRIQTVNATDIATLNIDHSNFGFASVDIVNGPGTETFNSLAGNQDAAVTPPIFADAAFHQDGLSPTVNAGATALADLGRTDVDGEARFLGTATDIGADELTQAAPADADGDGVPDLVDTCVNTPGPSSNGGCPLPVPPDTDGDGVPDSSDSCVTEAGPAENSGCPVLIVCATQPASVGCVTPDTTAPETTIEKAPKGTIEKDSALVKFSSSEDRIDLPLQARQGPVQALQVAEATTQPRRRTAHVPSRCCRRRRQRRRDAGTGPLQGGHREEKQEMRGSE